MSDIWRRVKKGRIICLKMYVTVKTDKTDKEDKEQNG